MSNQTVITVADHLAPNPPGHDQYRIVWSWQDISTAPKDGTPILAYFGGGDMFVVFWGNDYWKWLLASSGDALDDVPTHWLPLPEPPQNA